MRLVAELDAPCPPERLSPFVGDLVEYPRWLTIVTRAEAISVAPALPKAWLVDLTGHLGPLARSKRLRMVRTMAEPHRRYRFERQEADHRPHASWVLDVELQPVIDADGSTMSQVPALSPPQAKTHLRMSLAYDGGLFGPMLERILRTEVDQARPKLLALVTEPTR